MLLLKYDQKPTFITIMYNVEGKRGQHGDIKHFPFLPPAGLAQSHPFISFLKIIISHSSFHASPLMPYTSKIHFFSLSLSAKPGLSVKRREQVANLSQHGRGREICILNFKELLREAENINAYFLKQPPTVELCIKRM